MKKTKRILSLISVLTICGGSLTSMSASAGTISKTYEDYEQYLIDSGYVKMSSAHLAYDNGHHGLILDNSLEDRFCAYYKPVSDEKTSYVRTFSGIHVDKTGYDYIYFRTSKETEEKLVTELITSIDPDLQLILSGINESGGRNYHISYGIDSCRYMSDELINLIYNTIAENNLFIETFKYYGPTFKAVYTVGSLDYAMFPVKNLEALDAYLEETGAGFEYIPKEYSNSKECIEREGHSETDDCPKIEWVYCDLKQTKEYTEAEYWTICNDIARITEGLFAVFRPEKETQPIDTLDYSVEMHANVKGDANDDGNLALSDAITIMQTIGNPDVYKLTAQGEYNADIAGDFDGITNADALAIQRKLLGLE